MAKIVTNPTRKPESNIIPNKTVVATITNGSRTARLDGAVAEALAKKALDMVNTALAEAEKLQATVEMMTNLRQEIQETVAALQEQLEQEIIIREEADAIEQERAIVAENDLAQKITQETAERIYSISSLTASLNNLKAALEETIVNEADRAKDKESELETKLKAEIDDRQDADKAIQEQLNTEVAARQNSDNVIENLVLTAIELTTKLEHEVANRKSADSNLKTNLTEYINAVKSALNSSLDDEKLARKSTDNVLENLIIAENERAAQSEIDLSTKLDTEIAARIEAIKEANSALEEAKLDFTKTIQELTTIVDAIPRFSLKVVDELPTDAKDINVSTIYLVKCQHGDNDSFDEWVYSDGKWEKIGGTDIGQATFDYVAEQIEDALADAIGPADAKRTAITSVNVGAGLSVTDLSEDGHIVSIDIAEIDQQYNGDENTNNQIIQNIKTDKYGRVIETIIKELSEYLGTDTIEVNLNIDNNYELSIKENSIQDKHINNVNVNKLVQTNDDLLILDGGIITN